MLSRNYRPHNEIELDITHAHDGPVTRFVAISRAANCVRHHDDPSAVAEVLYRVLFGNASDCMLNGDPLPTMDMMCDDTE